MHDQVDSARIPPRSEVPPVPPQPWADAPLPPITEVQRLTIRPGDRLIAKYGGRASISAEQARTITAQIRRALALPDDFPIAIADQDWHFIVADQGEQPDNSWALWP